MEIRIATGYGLLKILIKQQTWFNCLCKLTTANTPLRLGNKISQQQCSLRNLRKFGLDRIHFTA